VQKVAGTKHPLMQLDWADNLNILYGSGYSSPLDTWVVSLDSGNPHKLLAAAWVPRWSAAAKQILYLGGGGFITGMGDYRRDPHLSDADGSNQRLLVPMGGNIQTFAARWSAGGSKIVLATYVEKPPA
jgi:hypothetical protein